MLFNYSALDNNGEQQSGSIDAVNIDTAITTLQKRGLTLSSITPYEEAGSIMRKIPFFNRVATKDVVILSRQMATLFEAQVSALRVFRLIGAETDNVILKEALEEVAEDIQGGLTISKSLEKHPNVFSDFYVNMVKSGEETGKLDETFSFLADYLDRTYEVTSKARNALIYPAFVVTTFIVVMIVMFTVIIPRISVIIMESGQELPIYTRIVVAISDFLINYGLFLASALIVGGFFLFRYIQKPEGRLAFDQFKLSVPYIGSLYRKLYLSRIADNMNTMISSGIPMVKALETTAAVVDNMVYKNLLNDSVEQVRGGSSLSAAFAQYEEIPGIMTQMVKVGEETGELGKILSTLAKFYQREVMTAVDTLVDMIEPVMIVALGLGVGVLLASVLMPIYNVALV